MEREKVCPKESRQPRNRLAVGVAAPAHLHKLDSELADPQCRLSIGSDFMHLPPICSEANTANQRLGFRLLSYLRTTAMTLSYTEGVYV